MGRLFIAVAFVLACAGATLAHGAEDARKSLRSTTSRSPLLLAQADRPRPMCTDDEKQVPRGSKVCRLGRVLVCSPRGSWDETGKRC